MIPAFLGLSLLIPTAFAKFVNKRWLRIMALAGFCAVAVNNVRADQREDGSVMNMSP